MHKHVLRLLLSSTLLAVALPVAAQKVVIESQGQAEIVARAQALNARGVADAIGQAPEGKGQIVFYRASSSPGAAIGVQEGETALIDLEPGMYFVVQLAPGMHGFDTGGSDSLGVEVGAGQTHYVQVIRNRAGQPQLRRSNAAALQRTAAH